MKRQSPLFGAAVLLSVITCLSFVFSLFSCIESGAFVTPCLPLWIIFALVYHFMLSRVLLREHPVNRLIMLSTGFFLMQSAACFSVFGRFSSPVSILVAVGMWLASYYISCDTYLHPVTSEQLISHLDGSILLLFVGLAYCSVTRQPLRPLLPLLLSCVVTMAAAIARRSSGGRSTSGAKGVILLLSAICGMILLAAAAVLLLGGYVSSAVRALWGILKALAVWIYQTIGAFFLWLLSRLTFQVSDSSMKPPEAFIVPEPSFEQPTASSGTILLILLTVVIIGIITLFVFLMRHSKARLSVGGSLGESGIRRKRPQLSALLAALFRQIRHRLRFAVLHIVKRNTAAGVFCRIQRQARLNRIERHDGETCRQFLLRTASIYPGCESELERLSDALDAHFFDKCELLNTAEAVRLWKTLKNSNRKRSQ